MRILAVDDDPSILELLTCVLGAFGYEDVVTARSGQEALDILAETTEIFDCLLLDVQMPEMNGITLCEHARNLPDYQFTPIIMITAMVQKQYIDEAFEVGATDYVTKPFEFADLKQRLSDAYRLAAERRAAIEVIEADVYAVNDSEINTNFRLSDPLYFGDLPGCIGLAEFENYVVQLSTMHSRASKMMAVKVAEVDDIFRTTTSVEFREAMAAAGNELLTVSQEGRNFATYWGNGVFLLIHESKPGVSAAELQHKLANRFVKGSHGSVSGQDFSYHVGEVVALRASSKMEALFLIDKAVELADIPNTPVARFG
ncbi:MULTISPECIES: response regulator [unclassified Ruegeria]|uniref:response regulator n=1 Tax=unclassified Ruegeria TaxID=2625375 RepID=UPI001ADA0DA5|nr:MULTISPECIES: response regulator [unclassified Ruegeria]MBO9412986.1 response regulator [Ruegeria sp. R8_1]MBO9416467.1 response regulator [Ruegeria sp. R8_2]